jgi:double-stranded uracil-DNA glycosylase
MVRQPRRAPARVEAVSRPTPAELQAAQGRGVADLIGPHLRVLFCGINPSLYSAAVGYHFARPGNRFWPTLYRAGFTARLLRPDQQHELLAAGIGITNVVSKASARADELAERDYREGGRLLRRKLQRYQPRAIAFLGLGAYRIAAQQPGAAVGRQEQSFAGIETWALPNPSGLNAHYSLDALVACYRELERAVAIG